MECNPLRNYMRERDLTDHVFLRRVLSHIEKHALFEHRFFQAFSDGRLTIGDVGVWAKQRLFSSQRFAYFLGVFLSHLPDGPAKQVFIRQKSEEEGDGNPEKAHSKYLERLICALGVSSQDLDAETMLPGTCDFVGTFMRISCEGDILKGMSMYGFGEAVIAMEMTLLLEGLDTIPGLLPEDKEYCSKHALIDEHHAAELLDVLWPYLKNSSDEDRAWRGLVEILDARKGFYDGIVSVIGI